MEQEDAERAIFSVFVAVSGMPIDLATVESRRPPEPDILCEVRGNGHLAFELGEVISESLEQVTSERAAVRRRFCELYAALSADDHARIETCLGGAPVMFVGFQTNPGRWRRAVKPIVDALVDRACRNDDDRLQPGVFPVWRIPSLEMLVSEIEVTGSTQGLFLGVLETTDVVDVTHRLLQQKSGKQYEASAPIELLAYFIGAPPLRGPDWHARTLQFITARLPSSPFRRVWLLDFLKKAVILVHPPVL
jgi:hypothetical protein